MSTATGREFNFKQQRQESGYGIPYHWFIDDPSTMKGRQYCGYLFHCADIAAGGRGGPLLDAGCGDARFLGELSRRNFSGPLFGIDYSERALAFGRLLVPGANFLEASLEKIPFDDGYFSQIFCIETLEHIDPEVLPRVVAELRRVLKPGGHLVVTVPSKHFGEPRPESKHYQHFDEPLLRTFLEGSFSREAISVVGQDNARSGWRSILKIFYRLLDNRLWDLRPLRAAYNLRIWRKVFNLCAPSRGRRLIATCLRVD